MEIDIIVNNGTAIAEILSDSIEIGTQQDALDIIANCIYQGAQNIIIHEKNITPAFFDLKTGIAGEIFQKCSNYNVRLAIAGDFSKYPGQSLKDLIVESNKGDRISFVDSAMQAREKLLK